MQSALTPLAHVFSDLDAELTNRKLSAAARHALDLHVRGVGSIAAEMTKRIDDEMAVIERQDDLPAVGWATVAIEETIDQAVHALTILNQQQPAIRALMVAGDLNGLTALVNFVAIQEAVLAEEDGTRLLRTFHERAANGDDDTDSREFARLFGFDPTPDAPAQADPDIAEAVLSVDHSEA